MIRRLVVAILAGVLALAACSAPRSEPGLFGRRTPPPTPGPSPLIQPGPIQLPVSGETTWTTTDGQGVTVRMAVHGLRRMPGATVLDWSLTPLSAAGRELGDPLPTITDLGLGGSDGTAGVLLVDRDHRRVYRPLLSTSGLSHCLCTPLWYAAQSMIIGHPRLLELTFPPLPDDVSVVDVVPTTAAPMWRIPVSPEGTAPLSTGPVNLTAPVDVHPPLARTAVFGDRQQFVGYVDDVISTDTYTTLRWTVQAVTDGDADLGSPPFTREPDDGLLAATGPTLRVGDRALRVQTVGADYALTCLCSDLTRDPALRTTGSRVTLVTTYPPLPRGTQQVDVAFPGLPVVRGVPTSGASNGANRAGPPASYALGPGWSYDPQRPPSGWEPDVWPTPLPAADQLGSYAATVERLR